MQYQVKVSSNILILLGINCLKCIKGNMLITGARDSSVAIWGLGSSKQYPLLSELKGHSDWITDLCLNKDESLLFSSSHDMNIHIWKLKGFEPMPNVASEIYPINTIHELNSDYIKTLAYCDYSATLFSGGLDAKLCAYNIDYSKKQNIRVSSNNLLIKVEDKSIYSIDINNNGNLVAASVYENLINVYDIRSSSSCQKVIGLDRHNGMVKKVLMSPAGDYVSCSYFNFNNLDFVRKL